MAIVKTMMNCQILLNFVGLDAAEDELFAAGLRDLREMKQERERGYRLPPA